MTMRSDKHVPPVELSQPVDRSFTTTEAFLHTLSGQASLGILLSDPQGNCHFVNQRLSELSGLTLTDAVGEGWATAIHVDDRTRVLEQWYEAAHQIRPFEGEFRFHRADGTIKWVHGEGFALCIRPSEVSGHFLIIRDITARKQAVEALRVSEERYRSLVHLSPHAIFVTVNESIAFTNQAGLKLLGVSSVKDLLGRSYCEFLAPSNNSHPVKVTAPDTTLPRIATLLRNDGTPVEVEIVGTPMNFDGLSSLLFIFTDISERKRVELAYLAARNEAEAYRKDVRRMEAMAILSGGIAHEFNNCLTAILGFSELAIPWVSSDSKAHGHLQQVVAASRRARDLANQILLFNRRGGTAKQPVAIYLLLKETIRFFKPTLQNNILLETWIQASTRLVLADPTQLHQAFVSLLANAQQIMKLMGGTLIVRLNDVRMEPSIDPAMPQPAGGEYVCLTMACQRNLAPASGLAAIPPGMGGSEKNDTEIGLAVVESVVSDHGGFMRATSEGVEVYLPAMKEKSTETTAS